MAIYTFQAEDGSIIQIEGPENATEEELAQALAQLTGDTQEPVTAPEPMVPPPPMTAAQEESDMALAMSQLEQLNGGTMAPSPEPSTIEKIVGVGETLASTGTGATSGFGGMIRGTLYGLAEEIASGQFGTQEAAQRIKQRAEELAREFTYEPRTRTGQKYAETVGEIGAELAPLAGLGSQLQVIGSSARQMAPVARAGAGEMGAALSETQELVRRSQVAERASDASRTSMGAAKTSQARQNQETAAQMPVPFVGEAAPTKGQSYRDFERLQFERETAKIGAIGEPMRERLENQTEVMLRNFDALIDIPQPIRLDTRDIGKAVAGALENKANVAKKKINDAYTAAREQGELEEPVSMEPLISAINETQKFESLAPNARAIRQEAERMGAIVYDENGNVSAGRLPLNDAEMLRQFVNEASDIYNPRESRIRRIFISAIDEATQGSGGEMYKEARSLRTKFMQEFENTGITKRLMAEKKGTSERVIAFEDVFKKIMLDSSIEEINKLRSTLLKGKDAGKQAWADLKARLIAHIKEQSTSPSQTDSRGNQIILPDRMVRTINMLDRDGKLDAIYGKRQAQIIRDLAELAQVLYTVPPSAINPTNHLSALSVALDSVATFGVTGLPVPVATSLKELAKHSRNRQLQARLAEALKPIDEE